VTTPATDLRGSILGTRVLRREDPALITGRAAYVDDIAPADAAHVVYVTSPIAHARITALDVEDARRAPGVLAVFTAADLPLEWQPAAHPRFHEGMKRPYLAVDEVRYVGEPVAAIVATDLYLATDAAEAVVVDYEPLDPIVDPKAAAGGDGPFAHSALDTNIAFTLATKNRVDFADCEVVVTFELTNQRVAPAPIEARVAIADWTGDRIVQWTSSQGAHPVRDGIAKAYGLDRAEVRVISKDVGGSFGAKGGQYGEEIMLAHFSKTIGRPVRWAETRSQNMVGLGHGRAQVQTVTIGGRRDGTILGYHLDVVQDSGAYPAMGTLLPSMTRTMLPGCYAFPEVSFDSRSVVTNTTPVVSYRGAGRPEATACVERAIDRYATEIGMDPAEVRRVNLIPKFTEAYTTAIGTAYDTGDYVGALETALDSAGYADLRAEQARRRAAGDRLQLGIGLSVYVEITAYGGGAEYGAAELRPDGTLLVKTGSSPYGQGHHTSWAMLASARTGIPMDRIEIFHGDTDLVPAGGFTGGSRSLQIAGTAVDDAAAKLVELARSVAAQRLEADVEDIVLDAAGGRFHVAGTPAVSIGWDEVAADAGDDHLVGLADFKAEGATFPFGAHVCVVEVDVETGHARIARHIAVDDAGVILNPDLVDGQVHGGLAQGAAQALLEEFRYDDDGNPLTANFADYTVVSTMEVPSFERIPMETPTFVNPLGAKGIGESGTIGATPAVQNAVVDAVSHLGVTHIDMPCTPQRVWEAINAAARG